MSSYSLPALIAFAINVSLVVIIILDNPRSRAHQLLALLVFCFALWNIADIIVVNSATLEAASVGGAMLVASLAFASTFFLVLSFSFPRSINSRFDRLPLRPIFLVPPLTFSILAGLGISRPLDLYRFEQLGVYGYVVNTSAGVLDLAMYAMVFGYLAWGMGNLVIQFRGVPLRRERHRIGYILFGTIGFASHVILLDVLRHNEALHFYTSRILSLLISLSFAYVVLGNRLLVLRRVGKEGLAYALVTGLVFAFYLIVIKNIAETFGKQLGISSVVLEILLILALALAFRPLVVRIQSLVENLFSQNMFRRRQKFIQFSRTVFHLTSLSDLAEAVRAFLMEALSASDGDIFIEQEEVGAFQSVLSPHRTLHLDSTLMQLLRNEHKAQEVVELLDASSAEQRAMLKSFIGSYFVPLLTEKRLIGILAVGPKTSAMPYTVDEEEFLAVFANEVTMGVERNRLLEKMRAEEVRAAQIEKLAALGRLTAGIAHEFRNPLNIIATSAQTILRNPNNAELNRETGQYILDETARLSRTVDEFLQFAKPHTPAWQQVVLDELIENAIAALQQKAETHGVRITKEVCDSPLTVITSPQQLERALTNLGINAIEAMHMGGSLRFTAHRSTDAVVLRVHDTGPGIPAELQSRLFDPFFTTKPTGIGLGLPIAYMMVNSIKGEISFSSSAAGTTFIIELPLNPDTL